MPEPLSFSLVVATIQGWPDIADCVASCRRAVDRVHGEFLVLDGSGRPAPRPDELGAARWISRPGESVFQLHTAGYALATGAVVATTEDHCRVPPTWAAQMLEAHRLHPEAAAIGGAVENGAKGNLLDWASYFVVQILNAPPLHTGVVPRLAGLVNVSYKRHALQGVHDHGGVGTIDGLHQRALAARGEPLIADDRIVVAHDQSLGFRGTAAAHFHAGRTMAAVWRQRMDARTWVRAGGTFAVPWLRLGRILVMGTEKRRLGMVVKCMPHMILLLYCQAWGQYLGFAKGPGNSPQHVQ